MSYWVAQIDMRREGLATYCLQLAEYELYAPRVRTARERGGHRVVPLFPGYLFLLATARGWWRARWAPGVVRLVLGGGEEPATVSDAVIDELQSRERGGLIVLPPPLRPGDKFRQGDRVKITDGVLRGLVGLVEGMRPHERVGVLLELLGSVRPIELPSADVERLAMK
jgi:transcription antitermination factor NusG